MSFLFKKKPIKGVIGKNNNAVVYLNDLKENKEEQIEAEVCLVAIGREPFTKNLGIENLNVKIEKDGRI